ncbi:hypothetical protein [Demequina subtropica]|uniref:hypothetical protein n=1 Tax=Demequina subtropica TaxID=1638989 RepID=UPI0007850940|nr:hypothetical protein [Demequina subtropica]
MLWGTDVSPTTRAAGLLLAAVPLAGCAGGAEAWEWQPGEDASAAPEAHYYYDYAQDNEFTVGPVTAVVTFEALSHNVLVDGTDASEPWTYTPAEVKIVGPGNSGLETGDLLSVAIPGGTAEGVTAPSLWKFDKAEIDPESRYLLSWTPYEYPNFTLESVVEFLYEYDAATGELERLQANPEEPLGGAPAVFTPEDEPVTVAGEPAVPGTADAVESLLD